MLIFIFTGMISTRPPNGSHRLIWIRMVAGVLNGRLSRRRAGLQCFLPVVGTAVSLASCRHSGLWVISHYPPTVFIH
jgi:hypothetical protein